MFKYLKQYGLKASFAAIQVELGAYAQFKLPSFYQNNCFYTKRSLEQCSSEQVAHFKASVFKGTHLLILAAGLGIDDWAFSFTFDEVVSVEPDEELNAISKYNCIRMQRSNIERITLSAEKFISINTKTFDLIYIDPDRRKDNERQILLSQHQPDVIGLIPELKKISKKLLIKCSPMYDHEMGVKEVGNIKEIYIISFKGEVKEMLLSVDFSCISKEIYNIHCIELDKQSECSVSFKNSDHDIPFVATHIGGYLYEASAGIIKVRKHHHYASLLGLGMIDKSIPFYCSEEYKNQFIGRCFRIIAFIAFKPAVYFKYLYDNGIKRGNIKVRGLKFNTAFAYKKMGIKEGGKDYFFIFPYKGKSFMTHCRHHTFIALI